MTGNNKIWRASLAGLASVAMLATMGVTAANAATVAFPGQNDGTFQVSVYRADKPLDGAQTISNKSYGDVVDLTASADPYKADKTDHKTLAYFSYDLEGKNKVADDYVVTGDVKIYAQYQDAVTVGFDTDGDKTADNTVEIAKGASLTAKDYTSAFGVASNADVAEPTWGGNFVGWAYTYNQSHSAEDLYEDAAITADTTLYPSFAKDQNVASVAFRKATEPVAKTLFTLDDHPFPAYRAPQSLAQASWDYDFKTPVDAQKNTTGSLTDPENRDLTVTSKAADADAANYTVQVNMNGATSARNPFGEDEIALTKDAKLTEPATPAWSGKVFTGWYLTRAADGQSVAYDFNKTVGENFKDATGVVQLYAGWDEVNVARLQFNLNYKDNNYARLIQYVNPGTKATLPTGLQDFYQTDAQFDAAKGEYTARTLAGWKNGTDTITELTAPAAGKSVTLEADWTENNSYRLDANGGAFADGKKIQWADAAENASSVSFPTPTRDGYTFAGWKYVGQLYSKTDGKSVDAVLNSANAKFYKYDNSKQGFFDITSKPLQNYYGEDYTLFKGAQFVALWIAQATDVTEATYNFNGVLKYESLEADYASVEAAGYTKDSAKAFVDAMYALRGDYAAYKALTNGSQAKIDAAAKLAPKYAAAQALLKKSDVTVEPTVEKVPVYRLYNKYITTGSNHLFTTDKGEYDSLVAKGWQGEGEVFQATSDKSQVPVYRLYNKYDGSHHYTKDVAERDNLVSLGWTYEFIGFYAPSDGDATLYRLYNQYNGEHLFTTDKAENDKLVALGWTAEESGLKVYSAAK